MNQLWPGRRNAAQATRAIASHSADPLSSSQLTNWQMVMDIGFLGHNGFALGGERDPVLVDPILFPRYGEEYTSSPVEIYPPRLIDVGAMPTPSAVIISHEHSDHFHLPSLDKLDRSVPIVVGPTMINRVVECIEGLGFTVHRLPFGETAQFSSTLITLYPAGLDTVLWESRVSQVYARDADDPEIGGLFLAIDALLSERFVEDISSGLMPRPSVIAVSNNTQVTPPTVYGSLDRMRPAGFSEGTAQRSGLGGFVGLGIIKELVIGLLEQAPELQGSHFIFCGGGFLKDYEQMGPFPFSDQKQLAAVAAELVRHIDVAGPEPGELLSADPDGVRTIGRLSWLTTDQERYAALRKRRDDFLRNGVPIPMKRIVDAADVDEETRAVATVENGLHYFARVILLADLGRDLIALSGGPDRNLRPLLLKLLCETMPDVSFALDLPSGAFVPVRDRTAEESLTAYPYGIIVNATDLAAVLRGDLQIWDIVGVAMRSWYEGEPLNSPVALMYDAYGEQIRPDIACKVYELQLETIARGKE